MSEPVYYKITNKEECHNGFQYHDGLNILKEPFSIEGSCCPGGLYFTDIDNIHYFFGYGCYLREVYLPTNSPGFMMVKDPNDIMIWQQSFIFNKSNKWRANMIILGEKRLLNDPNTKIFLMKKLFENHSWRSLIENYSDEPLFTSIIEAAEDADLPKIIDCGINIHACIKLSILFNRLAFEEIIKIVSYCTNCCNFNYESRSRDVLIQLASCISSDDVLNIVRYMIKSKIYKFMKRDKIKFFKIFIDNISDIDVLNIVKFAIRKKCKCVVDLLATRIPDNNILSIINYATTYGNKKIIRSIIIIYFLNLTNDEFIANFGIEREKILNIWAFLDMKSKNLGEEMTIFLKGKFLNDQITLDESSIHDILQIAIHFDLVDIVKNLLDGYTFSPYILNYDINKLIKKSRFNILHEFISHNIINTINADSLYKILLFGQENIVVALIKHNIDFNIMSNVHKTVVSTMQSTRNILESNGILLDIMPNPFIKNNYVLVDSDNNIVNKLTLSSKKNNLKIKIDEDHYSINDALLYAIMANNIKAFREFISITPSLIHDDTNIKLAIEMNNNDMMSLLLNNIDPQYRILLLNNCCVKGNLKMFRTLIKKYKVNFKKNDCEPFKLACANGQVNIVNYMLDTKMSHGFLKYGLVIAEEKQQSQIINLIKSKLN